MGSTSKDATLYLLNAIWNSGSWPAVWREGNVIPIKKSGGNASRIEDHRPITLTCALSKILERILHSRLSSWAESRLLLAEEQAGFRKGRSTLDQLFTLNEIISMRKDTGKLTFCAFLDVRSAYDTVWRNGLLYRLHECGVSGRMFTLIKSMLALTVRRVVIQGSNSSNFSPQLGLPQGAVLSPLLYALFVNPLAVNLNALNLGVEVYERRVSVLLYADDLVLLADNAEDLQRMLNCAAEFAKKWRFSFNPKPTKSEVVVIPLPVEHNFRFNLSNASLPVSGRYKYLGLQVGDDESLAAHVDKIVGNAKARMRVLWYASRGRAPLRIDTALHLFRTMVQPILEYAGGIWSPFCSSRMLTALDSVQIKFGKLLLRLPNSTAHAYVMRELSLQPMQKRLLKLQLYFFSHLANLSSQRLAGYIFQRRCAQVDQDVAQFGWCQAIKSTIISKPSIANAWRLRKTQNNWRALVNALVERESKADLDSKCRSMTSLSTCSML
jgi:hypothetical protein